MVLDGGLATETVNVGAVGLNDPSLRIAQYYSIGNGFVEHLVASIGFLLFPATT